MLGGGGGLRTVQSVVSYYLSNPSTCTEKYIPYLFFVILDIIAFYKTHMQLPIQIHNCDIHISSYLQVGHEHFKFVSLAWLCVCAVACSPHVVMPIPPDNAISHHSPKTY